MALPARCLAVALCPLPSHPFRSDNHDLSTLFILVASYMRGITPNAAASLVGSCGRSRELRRRDKPAREHSRREGMALDYGFHELARHGTSV